MEFWDSAITFFIVVLAAVFLVKKFLKDDGCCGCAGGCQTDDSDLGSEASIKDMRSTKNKSECTGCGCNKE